MRMTRTTFPCSSKDRGINTMPQPIVVKRPTMQSNNRITLAHPEWAFLIPQFSYFLQREQNLVENKGARIRAGEKLKEDVKYEASTGSRIDF